MLSGNKQFHVCGAAERVAFAEFIVRKRVRFCEFVKCICSREGALWMNTIHLDRRTLRECLASDDDGSNDDHADEDKAHQRRQPQLQRSSEHKNDTASTTAEARSTRTSRHRRGDKDIYVRIPIDTSCTGNSSRRHRSSSEANVDVISRCSSCSGDSKDSVDDDGQRDGKASCVYIACPALPCVASADGHHNSGNSNSSSNKQEKATRQQLSCFATLAASLSELLLSPMSAAAFAECVLGLLLEADVAYAHGTTARALAQRHLRTYRLRLQQQPPHRGLLADNDTTPGELLDALLSLPLTATTTSSSTTAAASSVMANTYDHVSSSGGGGDSCTNTTVSSLLPPATTTAEAGARAPDEVSNVGSNDRDNGCDDNTERHTDAAATAAAAATATFNAGAGSSGDAVAAATAPTAAARAAAPPPPLAMRHTTTLLRTLQSIESRTRYLFLSTEHEAYVAATPYYDLIAASLCSLLVFMYRRLCDYELLTSRSAVDRLLRIDKRVRQLVLRPLCDILTHVARQQMLNDVYVLSRGGLFADLPNATTITGVGVVAATSTVAGTRSSTAQSAAIRRGENKETMTMATTAGDGAALCRTQNKASHMGKTDKDQAQQLNATAPTVLCDNNKNKDSDNKNSSSKRQDEAAATSAAFLKSIVQSQNAALREADAEDAQLRMANDDSDSGTDNNDERDNNNGDETINYKMTITQRPRKTA